MKSSLFILALFIGITLSNVNVLYSNSEPCDFKNEFYSNHVDCIVQMAIDTIPASLDELDMDSVVFTIDTTYSGHGLGATEFVHQKAIIQSSRRFSDKSIERTLPLPYTIVYWHLIIQRYIFDLK